MKVKVINNGRNDLPEYKTIGAAGMDLRANISKSITLKSFERVLIGTGLRMEIPCGYEAQIRSRSGLAYVHGIICVDTPATIDSDYRGEIHIALINLSNKDFIINPGDRIAQLILNKIENIEWEEVSELSETERGNNGFGSTGI